MTGNLKRAVDLIKKWEGFRTKAYQDSAGVWTIGYGTTIYPTGKRVQPGDVITEAQATEYFQKDVSKFADGVKNLVKININDNEFCALVSFAYNVGLGALKSSTLLRYLNTNQPRQMVANQFDLWVKAGGKTLKGLQNRRAEEKKLFLEPVKVVENPQEPPESEEFETPSWFEPFKKLIAYILEFLFGKKEVPPVDHPDEKREETIARLNPEIPKAAIAKALNWFDKDVIKNKKYMVIVDMSKKDYEERFHLIDMKTYAPVLKTWCAHGVASDPNGDNLPDQFSNVPESKKSSLGAMRFAESYVSSKKKTGANSAFQLSRRIDGLEKGLNDKVRARAIVLHDGFYVTPERAAQKRIGDSWGCFVLYFPVLKEIFNLVEGCLLYNWDDSLEAK